MHKHLPFFLLCLAMIMTGQALGQDLIYLNDGRSVTGEVQAVEKKISYTKATNASKQYTVPIKKAAMICYGSGDITVFEGSSPHPIAFNHDRFDVLLTNYPERIPVIDFKMDESTANFVSLTKNGASESVEKGAVLAVFQKNHGHSLYAEPKVVAAALLDIVKSGKLIDEMDWANLQIPEKDAQVSNKSEGPAVPEDNVDEPKRSENPVGGPMAGVGTTTETNPVSSPQGNKNPFDLPVSKEDFEDKVSKKTDQLYQYFQRLADKSTRREQIRGIVNLAALLFISDTSIVEVSSLNRNAPRRFPIRTYLYHLAELKYDKVDITNKDIAYVTELKKGTDGNYYATVTILQEFKGYSDGRVVYRDLTEKRMEVVLKRFEHFTQFGSEVFWDVLLSNIKVNETYKS